MHGRTFWFKQNCSFTNTEIICFFKRFFCCRKVKFLRGSIIHIQVYPGIWIKRDKYDQGVLSIVNGIYLEIPPCRNNALLHRGFFTGSLVQFSRACLYFFMGWHFVSMDEPVNSLVSEKLQACIEVNRKTNQPNQPAPQFHSIFQPR